MEYRIDITEDEPDYYDPPIPEKNVEINNKRWSEDGLAQARTDLFETGSEFLPTKRSDIVGIEEVLGEIDDLIHWLRYASEYEHYNGRLEPGVIFEGSPGTGKTTCARYIATASNALFINVREWPHNNPLFTDADIQELFGTARKVYRDTGRPIVLFWDEFETNAKERANATPEQAAVVSQLTAELDGIHGKHAGILLIGCTNYYYGIDGALKRHGRMGLHIEFNPPDRKGKQVLLRHYLGKYKIDDSLDLDTLSYLFGSSATAAEIEEACMEAWRLAVKRTIVSNQSNGSRRRPSLVQKDLIPIFVKRLVGPPTSFITMSKADRLRIAIHETGHALAALIWGIPLRIITVQPGKNALGKVMTSETNEHIGSIADLVADMRCAIGSIVAEQEAEIPAAIGAASDVNQLNTIGSRLVEDLYAGPRTKLLSIDAIMTTRVRNSATISEQTLRDADLDIKEMLEVTYQDARMAMSEVGKKNLKDIARVVNDRVTLTGQEFTDVVTAMIGDPTAYRPPSKLPLQLHLN